MNITELKNNPLILEWFMNAELEENTKKSFLYGIRYYTDFVKKTPQELIEEAESEIEMGLLMRKRKIKQYLLTFREWLKNQDYAPKSVHNHMIAVRSFYKCFDIDLPNMSQRKGFRAIATVENGIRLEKEQIQHILKYANIRNKAIILVGASSGLAQADILNLTVGDYKKGFDEESLITTLTLRRKKTRTNFVTFLSPEATLAVQDYLDWRNREPIRTDSKNYPRDFNVFEKRRVRSDKDSLFIKRDIPDTYLKSFDDMLRRLNPNGFLEIFRDIGHAAGFESEKGHWRVVRSHNLRKFFNSTLLNAGCEFFMVEFWMGHKISETTEAYYRADIPKLRNKYMRYVPFLSLTDVEVRTIESDEYKKLKEEIESIKAAFGITKTADGEYKTGGEFKFSTKLKQLPDSHPLAKLGRKAVIATDMVDSKNSVDSEK